MKSDLNTIDLSKSRRKYICDSQHVHICPECGAETKEENCTVLLAVQADTDQGEFMTNVPHGYFCETCPVVVFDEAKIDFAAKAGMLLPSYNMCVVCGIVDLDSIPQEKSHLELGTDENPMPLVPFLPDLGRKTVVAIKEPGRNDPCSCGSGKKYKKCCGK